MAASLVLSAHADNVVVVGAANTASNLIAIPVIANKITVTATTANITTVKFYDTANTTTTAVQAAYTSYSSYATNWNVTFTNAENVVLTNTYVGTYTRATANSASTSSLPVLYTIVVPASSERVRTVTIGAIRGLTFVPNQNCIVEVEYAKNP